MPYGSLALALAGVVLAVEGSRHGELRHRLFAAALGGTLALPLAVALLAGRHWRWLRVRLALASAGAVAALGVAEVALRWFGSAALQPTEAVADPVLGHRLLPHRGGIDGGGFRNAEVPARASIVCIGDSQTYGQHVARSQAYPQLLGALTGQSVYNMAMGGYGPVQYLALLDRALALRPTTLVIGLYFGNDLHDAHRLAGLPAWSELRDPAVRYPPPEVAAGFESSAPNVAMALLDRAVEDSRAVAWVYDQVRSRLRAQRYVLDLYWREPGSPRYDSGAIGTLFTPRYRLQALDPSLAAVRDGLRITLVCLRRIAASCRNHGVVPVLLLLPTKERTYYELLRSRDEPAALGLQALGEAEESSAARIRAEAEQRGIAVVDSEPALRRELESGQPVWPRSPDGHLDARGHAVVAEVLSDALAELGPARPASSRKR